MASIKGLGSIVQLEKDKPKGKCRSWKLVVSLGRDPRTGKYHQKARNFHGTYTEAKAALRAFHDELEGGELVRRNGWTFNEYAEHYVDARVAAGEIAKRTATTLRSTLRQLGHLIGGLRLQEITPEVIESAYIDLRNGESLSGKPLSGRTLYNINLSTYLMFQSAKEKGIVAQNPLDKVPMPKKDTKEKQALSAAQYSALLSALDPADRMQCSILLCAALGLRRSEAVGLSWGDVDFAQGSINVRSSCEEDADLKDPKTEAGYRILPMPEFLAAALMKRKADAAGKLLKCAPEKLVPLEGSAKGTAPAGTVSLDGKLYDIRPDVAVTCNAPGERTKPGALSLWWSRHRKNYGLEGCTLHGLRHSFLSLAAARGVHPAVMMRLAGHKNPNITMKIYTHVNMESKREAMEAMQAAYMLQAS